MLDRETFCNRLIEVFRDERSFGGRRLGYVAMDVLWLLTHSKDETGELIDAAILALEGGNYNLRETLYKRLIPTLGPPVLPALSAAPPGRDDDDILHEAQVVHAITAIDSDVSGFARCSASGAGVAACSTVRDANPFPTASASCPRPPVDSPRPNGSRAGTLLEEE